MKHSGKIRYTALGMALGMAVTGGTFVYADDVFQTVSAYLTNDVKIEYNGEAQTLPSGYNILNYGSRSYVPLRYVSELLGADVEWDNDTRKILINMEEPEPTGNGDSGNTNTDSNTTPQISDRIDTTATGEVPQAVETIDYRVKATKFTDDRNKDKDGYVAKGPALYIQIANKHDDETMTLQSYKTTFTVTNKKGTKTYSYISDVDSDYKDTTWDEQKCDEEGGDGSNVLSGYIRMPMAIQYTDTVDVTLYLYYGYDNNDLIPVTLHLDMSKLEK